MVFMEFHLYFLTYAYWSVYIIPVIFLTFEVSNIVTTQFVTFMCIESFIVFFYLSFDVCRICRLAPLSFGCVVGNLYLLLFFATLARALSISSIFSKNSFLLILIFHYCFSSFTFALISTINLYYFLPFPCFGFIWDLFWFF